MPHRSRKYCGEHPNSDDHAHQRVLQLRRFGELLPFERPAQQPDAILVGGFGGFQALPGFFEHRAQRRIHRGRQRQRHADGLALRSREILQILLRRSGGTSAPSRAPGRSARPRRHRRRNRRRRNKSPSLCARTPAWSRALPARPRKTACTARRAECVPRWSGRGGCGCRNCRRRRAERPRFRSPAARAASVPVDAGPGRRRWARRDARRAAHRPTPSGSTRACLRRSETCPGCLRRPAHGSGVAQLRREPDEISFGVAGRSRGRGRIEQRQTALIRGCAAPPVHLFLKPPPDVAPVAQVFGDAPEQLQRASAERRDFRGGGFEKCLRARCAILRAVPAETGRRRSIPAESSPDPVRPAGRAAALRSAG